MDYLLPVTTLIFPTGSQRGARQCVNVSTVDDIAVEYTKSFHLKLSTNDVNVELSSICNLTHLSIKDNDGENELYHNNVYDN